MEGSRDERSARAHDIVDATRRAAAAAGLTPRQAEVLALAAGGRSNAEIAEALVVAPGTVKKHLDNIYAALGVGSRAAASSTVLAALLMSLPPS